MIKKAIIPIFLFLIILFSVSASDFTNYHILGQNNFYGGTSAFSTAKEFSKSYVRCDSASLNPLVADLDGDGQNEIITMCNNAITLYNYSNNHLEVLDGIPTGTSYPFTFWHAYDVDGDGLLELIVNTQHNLLIFGYSNNSLYLQKQLYFTPQALDSFSVCSAPNRCVIITAWYSGSTTAPTEITAIPFDSNQIYGDRLTNVIATSGGVSRGFCFSQIKYGVLADLTNDKEDDIIFTFLDVYGGSATDYLRAGYVHLNASNYVDSAGSYLIDSGNFYNSGNCYHSGADVRFTSPLAMDLDGKMSDGEELALGVMHTSTEFRLIFWNAGEGVINQFPQVETGEGYLISNPFKSKQFPDTDKSVCVMGFDDSNDRLDLICGSDLTQELVETREYYFDSPPYTIDVAQGNFSTRVVHSLDTFGLSYFDEQGEINPDEILTTYGIFWVCDFPSHKYNPLSKGELCYYIESGEPENSAIPVDYQKNGRSDLLFLSENYLAYFDDQFVNQPPIISGQYFINPCIENPIKNNSYIEVKFTVNDIEGDPVTAWASLYYGESNEQNTTKKTQNSGSLFAFSPFDLIANQTGTYTLRFWATDQDNNNTPIYKDFTFNVATEGETFNGGCITSGNIELTAPTVSCSTDDDCLSTQKCVFSVCQDKETSDLINEIIPENTIPKSYYILISLFLLFLTLIGIPIFLRSSYPEMTDRSLIYLGGGSALLMWLFLISIGLMPAWTLVISLIFLSGIISFKIFFGGR